MNLEALDPSDLLGAIRYKSDWRFFLCTVAEWILDYASYDPGHNTFQSQFVFRNNLFTINEENFSDFLEAIQEYELCLSDVENLLKYDGSNNWPLRIVIDFDEKLYVNGFPEIGIHKYIPSNWRGLEDLPLNFVPDHIRELWSKS